MKRLHNHEMKPNDFIRVIKIKTGRGLKIVTRGPSRFLIGLYDNKCPNYLR